VASGVAGICSEVEGGNSYENVAHKKTRNDTAIKCVWGGNRPESMSDFVQLYRVNWKI